MKNLALYNDDYRYRDQPTGNVVEVKVYYSKGGMNYFTGTVERRGVYVSVTPLTVDGAVVGYTAFSGYKLFVLELGRYSPRKVEQIATQLDDHAPRIAEAFRTSTDDSYGILREVFAEQLAAA